MAPAHTAIQAEHLGGAGGPSWRAGDVVGNGPGGHPRVPVLYWPPSGPVLRLEILPLEIP